MPHPFPRQTLSISLSTDSTRPRINLKENNTYNTCSLIILYFLLEGDKKEWNDSYQAGNTHWVRCAPKIKKINKLSYVTAMKKMEIFFSLGGGAIFKYPSFYHIYFKNYGSFICPTFGDFSEKLPHPFQLVPTHQFTGDISIENSCSGGLNSQNCSRPR